MPESVYRVTDVIGVSTESWEAAARMALSVKYDSGDCRGEACRSAHKGSDDPAALPTSVGCSAHSVVSSMRG